jgi:hypothetical protein
MANIEKLGTLVQVELRDIWKKEDTDFTPWLARPENILAVGNAIGIELEVQGEEHPIGPFKADIYCTDTADDSAVLIENQLERTDHTHLGQLLTYAAGLDAVTIVWIAKKFADEHRAALDWLNSRTDGGMNFFGLEIELWRVDDSKIAPKFNVVCRPNDWVKSAGKSKGASTRNIQLQTFWTDLLGANELSSEPIRFQKPAFNWTNVSIGRSNVHVTVLCRPKQGNVSVQLQIALAGEKVLYKKLESERKAIEKEIGQELIWEEGLDQIVSFVAIDHPFNVDSEESRAQACAWTITMTRQFVKSFRDRVKQL